MQSGGDGAGTQASPSTAIGATASDLSCLVGSAGVNSAGVCPEASGTATVAAEASGSIRSSAGRADSIFCTRISVSCPATNQGPAGTPVYLDTAGGAEARSGSSRPGSGGAARGRMGGREGRIGDTSVEAAAIGTDAKGGRCRVGREGLTSEAFSTSSPGRRRKGRLSSAPLLFACSAGASVWRPAGLTAICCPYGPTPIDSGAGRTASLASMAATVCDAGRGKGTPTAAGIAFAACLSRRSIAGL